MLTPSEIKRDLDQVEADGTHFRQRQDVNSKVRYSRWDGQSEDGKKHEANVGVSPFPWEGASDIRVRLAETVINDEVRILKNASKGSKLKVTGTEQKDWSQASKSTTLLRWMVDSQMSPQAGRETELAAQWRQEKGGYVTRVGWQQEMGEETDSIDFQEIAEAAVEMPEAAELHALIIDGGLDEEAAQILVQFKPTLTEKEALKAVKSLREDGIAEFEVPYLKVNRPQWTALRVYRDVYFPTYVDDLQRSPWIAERKYYTEEEINEKAISAGWKKSFVKDVLEHRGAKSLDVWSVTERNKFGRQFSYEETVEDQEDLYEIYHVYYKSSDKKSKAIGIYTYDMSYFVEDNQSQDPKLLDYKHGLYPFVSGVREYTERGIIQSRGIGEIMQTWQGEIKIQRDNAADRTSLDTIPPIMVPASRSGVKVQLGAGVQIPVRRPDEIQPLQLPNNSQNTELVIGQTLREVNEYFGREPENPQGNLIYRQDLIDSWLAEQKQVYEQTWALIQQFQPDLEVNIVTGGSLESFDFTREEIQGKYDLSIQFDARDLDAELIKEKIGFWREMMGMDSGGTIQSHVLIKRAAEWVDPIGAEEIISPPSQAQAKEFNKAQEVLTKAFSGVEPPPPDENAASDLQLQVIQDAIQKNPQLQQRYQEDEIYKGIIDSYVQGLQFQMQQRENAQIGRTGTQPFLDGQQ